MKWKNLQISMLVVPSSDARICTDISAIALCLLSSIMLGHLTSAEFCVYGLSVIPDMR